MNINANQDQPEETLNAVVVTDTMTDEEIDLQLDAELASKPFSPKARKAYFGKLRLLSRIHQEVSGKVNALRKANYELFFRDEDKFDPELPGSDNLLSLHFATIQLDHKEQAQPAGMP